MSCWALLGIDPISDKKEIKRVYAGKLKQLAVDEEPAAFQRLKEAFDQALLLADQMENETYRGIAVEADPEEWADSTAEERSAVEVFVEELTHLYDKKAFFDALEAWKHLFANELDWSMAEHEHIERIIQGFLLENYPLLARRIIRFLGEVFDFDKLLEDTKIKTQFSYYWGTIRKVPELSFDLYSKIDKEDRESYFFARYELYQLLANGVPERNSWRKKLVVCQGLCREDTDLIHLQIAYTLMKDVKLTEEHSRWQISGLFAELQALPTNETTVFLSNYIDWATANGEADRILKSDPEDLSGLPFSIFLLLTGQVYADLQEHSEAKARFELLEQIAPSLVPHESKVEEIQIIKPEKKWSIPLWPIVAAVLLLLRLVTIGDRVSSYRPTQMVLPETFFKDSSLEDSAIENPASSFSALRTSIYMHERFVYFFYIATEAEEGRQKFVEEHVSESEKERFLSIDFQNLTSLELGNVQSKEVSAKQNLVADYGQVSGLLFDTMEYPFVILQLDDDGKIKDVFGKGWTELEDSDYTLLRKSLYVTPFNSRRFFFYSFLVEDHRELSMEYQQEYTTDAVKQLLNANIEYMTDTYTFNWVIKDTYDDQEKEYTIFDYEDGEIVLIISYDVYGRIDHIYGEGWEKLDQEKGQQIFKNLESIEKNN